MAVITIEEVRRLAKQLPSADQLRLANELSQDLGKQEPHSVPKDLYGDWAGKFPEITDLDTELKEIRAAWKPKFDDV